MTAYGQQDFAHVFPFNDRQGHFFILMYFSCFCATDNKTFTRLEMQYGAEMV